MSELKGKGDAVESNTYTYAKDLSMKVITIGIIVSLIVTFLFFQFGVLHNWFHAAIGLLLVGVIAFLFTTVAANAIAIVGTNPVSGMTPMTLILASIILVAVGLKGPAGMVSALIIGGVVCTALSMDGGFITDLKIGYWLGSTPSAKQETGKFLGTLASRRYGREAYLDIEPDARFHDLDNWLLQSERCGRRYRAIDEMVQGTLGFIRNWSRPRRRIELLQDTGVGIRLGYVYPFGPEYAAGSVERSVGTEEAVAKTKA